MSYNLFLDDNRELKDVAEYTGLDMYTTEEWVVARNYEEFVDYIQEFGMPNRISFDHDLGDVSDDPEHNEMTGYDAAKWLIDYCLENDVLPPMYLTHTNNPVGNKNINDIIQSFIKFKQDGTKL